MDVFERVREVNTGVSLTDERIAGARVRLLEGIDTGVVTARKRASRRPMFLIAGAVAGVAAATATVVVVGQLTAPAPQVEAIPAPTVEPTRQPGEVLPHPAPTGGTGITEPFPGTTPQAGQYLSVQNMTETLLYRDGQDVYQGDFPYGPLTSALLVRGHSATYMPADRSGEWISVNGPDAERVRFFPEDQWPAGALAWDNILPVRPDVTESRDTRDVVDGSPEPGSAAFYAQFPADPQSLLDQLRAKDRGHEQRDAERRDAAVQDIVTVLRVSDAPASVRQTFVAALALSGAEVVSAANGITTYRMRYDHFGARTDTISISDATGWATEYTLRWDRVSGSSADGDVVPPTVPDIRMTYSVSIVDAVP
ncbi:hypothetical protein MRBLWO14_003207 [Microbacterium sp. LWO14-1.2]|uniref:hypothetical protein n=1 Tax=Microbacterium sp. LWO14-1.2 TaxID=3135263 RepID=UPI003138FA54